MSLAERIRRVTVWALYHLLPRSPRRAGMDEQMAAMTLYPTSRRGLPPLRDSYPPKKGARR